MVEPLRKSFEVSITLDGIEPRIWRRLRLPSTTKLPEAHRIFQIVMGWTDSHLHQFLVGDKRYGEPDPEFDDGTIDEKNVLLSSLLKEPGDNFIYEYDFGDCWEHRVVLEQITPFDTNEPATECVGGEWSCPPEDVGGSYGYMEFLRAFADASHPDHKSMRKWAGNSFQPEHFDRARVNQILWKKGR